MRAWFRRLRWWQRSLIAIGVLLCGLALLYAAMVVYFVYSFDLAVGSDKFAFHGVDEAAVAATVERRHIRIPDDFATELLHAMRSSSIDNDHTDPDPTGGVASQSRDGGGVR